MHHIETFQITDHPKLGLWFSDCWWEWNIGIGHYEKIKKVCDFINMCHTENFQIIESPLSWGDISIGYYEKIKKWSPFCKYTLYGKISNCHWPL